MSTLRKGWIFAVVAVLFGSVASQTALKGQKRVVLGPSESYRYELTAMQFIERDVGWVIADQKLFWTEDDGEHWSHIFKSHDHGLVTAFFLDAKHGWVLTSYGLPEDPDFRIFSTDDAGQHWEAHDLKLRPHANWLDNHLGSLIFRDTQHGWLDLQFASSSNFDFGWLLRTDDVAGRGEL